MKLINYGQFKAAYLREMTELLDQRGYSIRPVMIGEGLSLEKATLDLGDNICHCIDLQEVYSGYCKSDFPMLPIVKDALACFRGFGTEQREQVERIENVLVCVTNFKKSGKILQNNRIPYLAVGDMAVYFRFNYQQRYGGTMERIVTKDHLMKWNYSEEELFNIVRLNKPQEIGACAFDWAESPQESDFGHIPVIAKAEDLYRTPHDLYGLNGAGAILYPEVLRQFEEAFHEPVIIVPYSERKAALLPESLMQKEWVQRKIRENIDHTEARLLLSTHAYLYDRGNLNSLKDGWELMHPAMSRKIDAVPGNHEITAAGKKQSR